MITADDLGLNPAATSGVIQSLSAGLVSHASLIVNMPSSAEAVDLIHRHGFESRVGLHFNMTEGQPLTDEMRRSIFCIDGELSRRHFLLGLKPIPADARRAVAAEIRAQINAARVHGIALTHIDSHNNSHVEPNVMRIIAEAAREAGISRLRPARTCGMRQGLARLLLHRSYNIWLSRQGLRQSEHFGTVDDILWLAARGRLHATTSVEVMTHPIAGADGVIVDAPFGSLATRLERLRPGSLPLLQTEMAH